MPSQGKSAEMKAIRPAPSGRDSRVVKQAVVEVRPDEKKITTLSASIFMLGLFSGTFSAIICKMAYDTKSTGLDGTEKAFAKPIMMLLLMFLGMCPGAFLYLIQKYYLTIPEERKDVSMKNMIMLIIPCVCDLTCTTLLLIAQLYITASMWQMMRGSVIVITLLLKYFVMNHTIESYQWSGVSIITTAMVIVGSSSLFNPEQQSATPTDANPLVGISLVIIGCLAQGVQYVFEEKVLNASQEPGEGEDVPPLVVIGCEGFWGVFLTLAIVYPMSMTIPGKDVGGVFENYHDSIAMIQNSPQLQWLVFWFVFTVTVYNCSVIYVTKLLSAIWHAILDNFRTISVWVVDLLLYYVLFPGQGYGEIWTNFSYLQLVGLIFLLIGTGIYNNSFKADTRGEYQPLVGSNSNGDMPISTGLPSPRTSRPTSSSKPKNQSNV